MRRPVEDHDLVPSLQDKLSCKFVNMEIFCIITHQSEYPGTCLLKSLPTRFQTLVKFENTKDNPKGQTHSRVSDNDGQPSVQFEPSAVNRMVTASTDVQTDLSKVVQPSYRSTLFATHLNHKLARVQDSTGT